MEGVFEK
ncbi:hypothetical protein Avbf_00015 [Armadillidium vulgare]|nr:hypothetical protein Avbf_19139 [Armadillidium vulgare]RXG69193.1 hypothetical protein Avbf_05046 [Armadillidium vulgare]RXG71405.1 hypothetical protein Avbf_00015 [Armadillidium vulgare]